MPEPEPDLGWTPVDGCTLATADRVARIAEFDDLFAETLCSSERLSPTRARLVLCGNVGIAEWAGRLARAESACCRFFRFRVKQLAADATTEVVSLDVQVPQDRASVLTGLVARGRQARRSPDPV